MQAVSRIVSSSDGCRLYAEAAGNKDNPAILFVHGVSVSSAWWRKQFDHLSDRFYCVRFDLRGHGASEKPSDADAYRANERWADDMATIIDAFELNKPTVCVWSYGGIVLGNYLCHYGHENLAGLVMVNTCLQLNAGQAEALIQKEAWERLSKLFSPEIAAYRMGVEENLRALTLHPVEYQDRVNFLGGAFLTAPSTWQAMFDRTIDHVDVFQTVSLPALVVYGQQDQVFTPRAAEQIVESIPNAQISYYPCGHAPFYEEAERFNMELVQFVNTYLSR